MALAQSHRQDESHLRVVRERGPARARVGTIHDMVPYLFPQLTEERFVGTVPSNPTNVQVN